MAAYNNFVSQREVDSHRKARKEQLRDERKAILKVKIFIRSSKVSFAKGYLVLAKLQF